MKSLMLYEKINNNNNDNIILWKVHVEMVENYTFKAKERTSEQTNKQTKADKGNRNKTRTHKKNIKHKRKQTKQTFLPLMSLNTTSYKILINFTSDKTSEFKHIKTRNRVTSMLFMRA